MPNSWGEKRANRKIIKLMRWISKNNSIIKIKYNYISKMGNDPVLNSPW